MKDIVEDSIQAYDQRMEAETRINAVKEKSAKDLLLYNTEIKELMRIIDHESKLKEFMLIKFRQFSKEGRLFYPTVLNAECGNTILEHRLSYAVNAVSVSGSCSLVVRWSWCHKRAQSWRRETAQKALAELSRDGLYSLGNEFIAKEEKNYALFNFINEINIQLEHMQEKIQNIKDEILQIQSQRKQSEEEMHKVIKEIEHVLESTIEQTNKYEKIYTHRNKTLDQLKSSVESLAKKIHCDLMPIEQKLCGHEGILNFNALDYLGECS
ncbi:coiled-coil domain-containing protein 63-like [Mobula birostris]|uniref:coiled-coil domain-containing protein 63-like n=1 Tax=Mobula birostris TaxID=1983395 RepID=UPI003B27B704